MNLFFDLDGTLVDIRKRQYKLYRDYARLYGIQTLDIRVYQHLKRLRVPEGDIAAKTFPKTRVENYTTWRKAHIEDEKYLKEDVLYRGVKKLLMSLRHHNLSIVTSRDHRDRVIRELTRLGIRAFFSHLFAVGVTDPVRKKTEAIERMIDDQRLVKKDILLVGDSEIEYETAHALSIGFVGVSYGVRTKKFLTDLGARVVVDSVPALARVLVQ